MRPLLWSLGLCYALTGCDGPAPHAGGRQAALTVTPAKLLASDGSPHDWFGTAVAISGITAIAGAYGDDPKGKDSGSAYIYARSGSAWKQQAKLVPTDGAAGDYFGVSVAISGDTAVMGAYSNDTRAIDGGAAWVFVRSGSTWTQQAKLTASDTAVNDSFGSSAALDGDTALIGCIGHDHKGYHSGSAYVFVRSGTTWKQQAKLTASDGDFSDWFGNSVAIDGDVVLIGAPRNDDKGSNSGSAYVYVRSGTAWTQQTKIIPNDGAKDDQFGMQVSLSGHTALLGSMDDDRGTDSGAAYVYTRSGSTWKQQAKLTANDGVANHHLSLDVALSKDRALVGAPYDATRGYHSGAAYVFERTGTAWKQVIKLTASDGIADDDFGGAVSLIDEHLLVSASKDDDKGQNSGSLWIYGIAQLSPNGAPCSVGSTCQSTFCADNVCCDKACGGNDDTDCQACSKAKGASKDGACTLLSTTHTCRIAAGDCDLAETCTGSSPACPANAYKPSTSVCRIAAGDCDLTEKCTGSTTACPKNLVKANGTPCLLGNGSCQGGKCLLKPDASVPDASVPDASVPDVGLDWGPDVGPDLGQDLSPLDRAPDAPEEAGQDTLPDIPVADQMEPDLAQDQATAKPDTSPDAGHKDLGDASCNMSGAGRCPFIALFMLLLLALCLRRTGP